MVKEGLRPTTNSNTYDYRINTPSPNAPKNPDSKVPVSTKKRFKPKPKKQHIIKYTDTPDDLDLLGHYGSLGKNRLPVVTNTDNVVDHIVDEYKTKLNHPYFKDWH